jgi:hypothetical protein
MDYVSHNTLGGRIGEGLQGNQIVDLGVVENGGDNPNQSLKINNVTKSETGQSTTIVIGNVDIGSGGGGGTISGILVGYLRDLMTDWTQPMVDFVTEDISNTVLPNYLNNMPNSQNTMYLRDISNIQQYAPGSNVSEGDWTDNQLIATFALSSLGVVNRGLLLYLDNVDLQKQVNTIADQIRNELAPKLMPTQTGIMVDVTASALIDMRYLFYVEKYGPPMNGVFDPIKLAEFV